MLLKISNKVLGFDNEQNLFQNLYVKKKLPQAIMFQGLEGIGKFTLCLHLVSSFLKKSMNEIDENLNNNDNVLVIKKEDSNQMFKLEDIKKIINFCQLKSFDEKPRFIIMKNSNYLNNNSVNALLKLIEEPPKNTYFLFTCNLLDQNLKTLNSRFFIKKLFLNKKFYKQIINNFGSNNNLENLKIEYDIKDTPGFYLRKYIYNLNPNLEKLKKDNEKLFYNILCEKVLNANENNSKILKLIKLNLFLNNDIKKLINMHG